MSLGLRLDCLNDLRILDASRVLAGPFCAQVLGDLGADVIKVERPAREGEALGGDETRSWGPPFVPFQGSDAVSAYFLSCNRNKRSLTLDLSKREGIDLFYQLVEKSDVLLENFRAASADKLGLSPSKLHAVNPQLVVCSISGFGRTGPMSEVPGYDVAIQAFSGLMSITGPAEGPPSKVGVAVTDVLTGLNAAVAVLACLHARRESGHGYAIDLALLDCAVAAQVNVVQAYLATKNVPLRQGNAHLQIVPYQAFATKEGWCILAVGNDSQWQKFCRAVAKPAWANDERFATNSSRVRHRDSLVPLLEAEFQTRTTKEWEKLLSDAGVPHAPVWDYADLFASAQADARSLRVEVRDPEGNVVDLVGSPFHIDGANSEEVLPPSALGQYTQEILGQELGLSDAQIEQLRQRGVI